MKIYKIAQEELKTHPYVSEIESLKKTIPDMEGYWWAGFTKAQLINTLNKIKGIYEGSENLIPKKGSNTAVNLPNGEVMVIANASWKGTYKDKMYYLMFFRSKSNENL